MSINNAGMTRNIFFIVGFLASGLLVRGQSEQNSYTSGDILEQLRDEAVGDQVTIQVDSLLVANYYKFMVRNKKNSGVRGYRIRIYSESGLGAKEQQQRVRAKFLSYFPKIDAYYRYDEPFFKVYVGECRTKSEAIELDEQIRKYFPNPIIVPDFINIKSID